MSNTDNRTPRYVLYSASDQLLRLSEVSPLAELAHRRFADHFWATGTWPALGNASILRLARVTAPRLKPLLSELASLGWVKHAGHIKNPSIADTFQRALDSKNARVAAGLLGAAVRWPAPKVSTPAAALAPSPRELFPDPPTATTGAVPPLAGPAAVPTDGHAMAEPMVNHVTAPAQPLVNHAHGNAEPLVNQCLTNSQQMPINKVNDKVRNELSKSTVLSTSTTRLDAERLTVNPLTSTLSVSARKGEAGSEKEFLDRVREELGAISPQYAAKELTNWGGWWRNRFREDPDRATRVLAEIGSMCREGRILTSPGAAASDLYQRLP